jgi:protein ImuB
MSFAALFIPDFALQAVLRHTPELRALPVALIPENTPRACIIQATPTAHEAGVILGMTPSQGLARCRDLKIIKASHEAARCANAALFDYAWSISRFVEQTGPGICTVALDETQPHRGAEWREGLRQLNLHARIGIAPHPDLALLAAQSSHDWRAVDAANELGEISLEILEPSPAIAAIFRKWGIHTLHDFVRLGRERLVERLGAEVLPLFDRAAGNVERPLRCAMPAESFEEQIEFESEIETLEPLLFMVRRFVEQLTTRLQSIYRVIAELTLRLGLANGEEYVRIFKVPSPTGNVDVLFRMLHTHLENFRAVHPIASLSLSAAPTRPVRQQFGLFESALRDPNQFYETLARLSALVGHDRVGTVMLEPTHRPDAFRFLPECFGAPSTRAQNQHAAQKKNRSSAAAAVMGSSSAKTDFRLTTGLRLRRFRPAVSATVSTEPTPNSGCGTEDRENLRRRIWKLGNKETEQLERALYDDATAEKNAGHEFRIRKPVFIESREVTGAVIDHEGPMRLSGEWWCEGQRAWSRNEWDIQLRDGPLCRIYEEAASGAWFLEGIYD